ncbi:MAG: hypothetical protein ICV70_04885 [Jiangellaceae bacterium]|nr:hypothetical protein [Jiangellaceae bacterium]
MPTVGDVVAVLDAAATRIPPRSGTPRDWCVESVVQAGGLLPAVVDELDQDAVSGLRVRELWSAFDRAEQLCAPRPSW